MPYLSRYAEAAEEDGTVRGAYGPRLFGEGANNQVHNAIKRLRENPSSRRVVIQVLDKTDMLGQRYNDIPCTNSIQFLIRNDRLHTIVSMRSNDAWIGLVHDVFAFTMIQELVARDLGCDVGTYSHFAGSLHLYNEHIEHAERFLEEGFQSTLSPMEAMPADSPWTSVSELLTAERQARETGASAEIAFPSSDYWADLTRLLVSHHIRRAGRTREATELLNEITLMPISELLQRDRSRADY